MLKLQSNRVWQLSNGESSSGIHDCRCFQEARYESPCSNDRVTELVALALAGVLVGAALSATKRHAPRPLVVLLLVMAGVAFVLVLITFQGNH